MTALVACPLCGASEGYIAATSRSFDCDYELWCRACSVVVTTTTDKSQDGLDSDWNAAGAHAQALRDRVAALEAALRGLVGVKDMRLRLIKLHEMGHGTDYTDYYRLKPLAWAAARAALEQMP